MRPQCPHAPQGELYLLSQPGGPRYAPRRVHKLASEVLDALFPAGRWVCRACLCGACHCPHVHRLSRPPTLVLHHQDGKQEGGIVKLGKPA